MKVCASRLGVFSAGLLLALSATTSTASELSEFGGTWAGSATCQGIAIPVQLHIDMHFSQPARLSGMAAVGAARAFPPDTPRNPAAEPMLRYRLTTADLTAMPFLIGASRGGASIPMIGDVNDFSGLRYSHLSFQVEQLSDDVLSGTFPATADNSGCTDFSLARTANVSAFVGVADDLWDHTLAHVEGVKLVSPRGFGWCASEAELNLVYRNEVPPESTAALSQLYKERFEQAVRNHCSAATSVRLNRTVAPLQPPMAIVHMTIDGQNPEEIRVAQTPPRSAPPAAQSASGREARQAAVANETTRLSGTRRNSPPASSSGSSSVFSNPTEAGREIEATGLGGLTRAVFQMIDRMPTDAGDNVTYSADLERNSGAGVRLCNTNDFTLRIASLRTYCPLMSVLEQDVECEDHLGGWAELEPKQCLHIVTGEHYSAALAVYARDENDEWEPLIFSGNAEWEERDSQPDGTLVGMFQEICGYEHDFLLKGDEISTNLADCATRQQDLIFLNVFLRGKDGTRYTMEL